MGITEIKMHHPKDSKEITVIESAKFDNKYGVFIVGRIQGNFQIAIAEAEGLALMFESRDYGDKLNRGVSLKDINNEFYENKLFFKRKVIY